MTTESADIAQFENTTAQQSLRALNEPAPAVASGRAVAIETHGLSKRYPSGFSLFGAKPSEQFAVQDVTLSLGEGEIVGMVGPNGAGKTTFIRMLSTMILPTSGIAFVGGYDVAREEREVRSLLGVVSANERSFYWRLTGRENLRFFAALHHLNVRKTAEWIEELIDLLGLSHIVHRRFDGYSTGEKQRMAIARGLLTKPKILLMDEPTKGVDPVGASELIDLIKHRVLPLWHPTILVTSHNLFELEQLCSRVAMMRKGRMLAIDTVDALKRRVRKADHFVLDVHGIESAALGSLAEASGAIGVEIKTDDSVALKLGVGFAPGDAGFAALIRAIVEAGGDVLAASRTEHSLEQAFHQILAEHVADLAQADGEGG